MRPVRVVLKRVFICRGHDTIRYLLRPWTRKDGSNLGDEKPNPFKRYEKLFKQKYKQQLVDCQRDGKNIG